jgi:monofunctional biosynthetic peptidoglycan transglycosylase
VPVAEFFLGKKRIGAIPQRGRMGLASMVVACRYCNETAALNIGRQQAARLAAILPAPLKRRPQRMNNYSAIILSRMSQMGW